MQVFIYNVMRLKNTAFICQEALIIPPENIQPLQIKIIVHLATMLIRKKLYSCLANSKYQQTLVTDMKALYQTYLPWFIKFGTHLLAKLSLRATILNFQLVAITFLIRHK